MSNEYQNPENPAAVPLPEETETEPVSFPAETADGAAVPSVSAKSSLSESSAEVPSALDVPSAESSSDGIPAAETPADDAASPDVPLIDSTADVNNTAEVNNTIENPADDAASFPSVPAENIPSESLPVETSPEEQPQSGVPGDRDDYFTEEPPKLKYYNESERQDEINKYKKFKKVDGATYRKVNVFLRKRTYITAREWAIARLCADFKTPYGSEMTFIGEHLPELCPFMEETYSPQAVNQARASFKRKVRKSAATFLYGAMCGFFTPEELDDILFEANEVSKFFLEIEGTSLELDDEIEIEDKISGIMKKLGDSARILLKNRAGDEKDSADEEDGDEDEEEEIEVVPVEGPVSKQASEPSPAADSAADGPSEEVPESLTSSLSGTDRP